MVVTSISLQQRGFRTGASTQTESPTRHDAILLFEEARRRLLDVNHWDKLIGPGTASFQLTNDAGQPLLNVQPDIGNLIRIKLPVASDNHETAEDWVRIEEFENQKDLLKDEDIFGFRVRPVKNPAEWHGATGKFYTSGATSTFLITRVSSVVTAIERGRNETEDEKGPSFLGRIRDYFVVVGARIGFSKTQWSRLIKGIIKGPPDT